MGFQSSGNVNGISFDPMRFGSKNDLDIALTELKWIKKVKGKLANSDFATVSEKYKFPIDFLKKGLLGFSYPDDWLVSKSKWFPIIYSWIIRDEEHSNFLLKLQIDHLRTRFHSFQFLSILLVFFIYLDLSLRLFFVLDFLQELSAIIFPFVLSFIALFIEFRNNIGSKKAKLEEYSDYLEQVGLGYVVVQNERFIMRNYRLVAYAGNIILRKMRSAPLVQLFPMGMTEVNRQPSRLTRLLRKSHLLPKAYSGVSREKIPVFYGENPHIAYVDRIKVLAEKKSPSE